MSDYPIFDIHHHVGGLDVKGEGGGTWDIEEDYADRVTVMDRFGFRACAVMPSLQYPRPSGAEDTRNINNMIASYRDRHRDRVPVALGTVEPLYGIEPSVAEIERIAGDLKLDGVVWHHRFQGTFIADSRMRPFLRKAQELRLPAFIHLFSESTMESPWGLEALAEEFPEVTFVALDAFSGITQARYVMGITKRCPNVLLETGAVFPLGRLIEEFVQRFGSERLLFGTDLYLNPPMYHYPHVLTEISNAPGLSEQDKRNIFWNNARRLFRLADSP